MNVLAIGNSFSQDATRYLHQIAAASGVELEVVNLYIGGCSLERHWDNAVNDRADYDRECNGNPGDKKVTIREALEWKKWDVVTLQQVSHCSIRYETYQPFLRQLSDYVKGYAPQAQQMIHQTWAYEQGGQRLTEELGYRDQAEMFRDLQRAYQMAADDLGGLPLIPSGKAFAIAAAKGIGPLHRDGFHASLGLGRFLLGAVWYQSLTGNSIFQNDFCDLDEPVALQAFEKAKVCAYEAVFGQEG